MMEDLISRREVTYYLNCLLDGRFSKDKEAMIKGIRDNIMLLPNKSVRVPSVQPERKTGRWIDDNCSECGQYVFRGDVRNFCPNCGAKTENDS